MKDFTVPSDCQVPNIKEVYNNYFSNIDVGFFVEVGAHDGRSSTNTGFLADVGWKGIYIEPVKSVMNRCKENHKDNNVIFEQVAIGRSETTLEIYTEDTLSTLDQEVCEAHKVMYPSYSYLEKELVSVKPLTSIFKKYNVMRNFELLVVDVEGYETEVFDSFDLEVYRPKMIIVELCDVHDGYLNYPSIQSRARQVREHILNSRYDQILVDTINTIFWNTDEQF